jgi:hypothetical protein
MPAAINYVGNMSNIDLYMTLLTEVYVTVFLTVIAVALSNRKKLPTDAKIDRNKH